MVGDEKLGERGWLEIKLRKLRTEIVGRPVNANLGVEPQHWRKGMTRSYLFLNKKKVKCGDELE